MRLNFGVPYTAAKLQWCMGGARCRGCCNRVFRSHPEPFYPLNFFLFFGGARGTRGKESSDRRAPDRREFGPFLRDRNNVCTSAGLFWVVVRGVTTSRALTQPNTLLQHRRISGAPRRIQARAWGYDENGRFLGPLGRIRSSELGLQYLNARLGFAEDPRS